MNKKTKVSIILSALAAIGVASSVMAGGTYALFTSESKVNIAVTSGKVDITATISDLEAYSPTSIDANGTIVDETNAATNDSTLDAHVFKNGGKAAIVENSLKLDGMTPGDKVSFKIKLTNNSNISIKYRTKVAKVSENASSNGSTESNLFNRLKIKIGDIEISSETSATSWTELSLGTTEVASYDCSVELPATVTNTYQNKSCSLSFTVEAMQGNKLASTD